MRRAYPKEGSGIRQSANLGAGLLSVQRLPIPLERISQALLVDVVRSVGALKELRRHSSPLFLWHPKVPLGSVVSLAERTNGLLALRDGIAKRACHDQERTRLPFLLP